MSTDEPTADRSDDDENESTATASRWIYLLLLVLAVGLVLAVAYIVNNTQDDPGAPAFTGEDVPPVPTTSEPELVDIVDTADAAGDFTVLLAAVDAADLTEALRGEGPFTVFAPTDDAFDDLLDQLGLTADELLADTDILTSVLLHHVVEGDVRAADVLELDGEDVGTLGGATVAISVDGETVMVDDATVTAVDVEASNGVIHVIDSVLLPPDVADALDDAEGTAEDATAEDDDAATADDAEG